MIVYTRHTVYLYMHAVSYNAKLILTKNVLSTLLLCHSEHIASLDRRLFVKEDTCTRLQRHRQPNMAQE